MKLFSASFIILIILIGCSAQKSTASLDNTTKDTPSLSDTSIIISFEQTACLGTCPVHKLVILNNGMATYHGERNVNNIGDFTLQFSPKEIQNIYSKAEELNFFDLEEEYTAQMTDFPTSYIRIVTPNQSQSVKAYGSYPENLEKLISFLFEKTQEKNWDK